jgi:hypothetical protein
LSIEVTLFLLRLVSAALLLIVLGAFMVIIWRDYRLTVAQMAASRRSHGHLVAMREVDNSYVLTGDIYPLLPLTSLGRSPTNTIRIDDNFASSEHALLARRNGQWWLEDRRSRNGTMINGVAVSQPVVVTNGDVIGIGKLYFRVDFEQ